MTREELINNICPECNKYNCDDRRCEDCDELLNKWLDEYDKQIRAEVVEEMESLISQFDDYCDAMECQDCWMNKGDNTCLRQWIYRKFKQLKEQEQ